ncbi:unnamed protein product [Thelazia callipaeda]|uniref:PB1 domain-containing protein n=1 Tax=Thelazia callipaeda TaxID=103827 RepID=A0A0N5D8S2_THECL|nr:unnamed protein product [Thelazia callipaeda]
MITPHLTEMAFLSSFTEKGKGQRYNVLAGLRELEIPLPCRSKAILTTTLNHILLQKIREQCPDFDGILASYDNHGDKTIVATDEELRQLLHNGKNRLKMYTIRNHSLVHPSKSPSVSFDVTPLRQLPLRSLNFSRLPPPTYYESQEATKLREPFSHQLFYSRIAPFSNIFSSSYGCYRYAHACPVNYNGRITNTVPNYGHSLIYGYPPQASVMYSFLCSPFPFSGYHKNWICGPKCFSFSLGGKHYRSKYSSK